jgi:hypothetical protein
MGAVSFFGDVPAELQRLTALMLAPALLFRARMGMPEADIEHVFSDEDWLHWAI